MKVKHRKYGRVLAVILAVIVGAGGIATRTILSKAEMEEAAAEVLQTEDETASGNESVKKEKKMNATDFTVSKEETVFATANPDGSVSQVSVSDWLKNSGNTVGALLDKTDLTDIENVKGDETFLKDGRTLVWNMDDEDIYYQGSTTQRLPVDMQVTYYLNGEKIAPAALAGQNGHVRIEVAFTNHAEVKKKINGKMQSLYSPFVTVTGMVLPVENFTNITVDNGKCISDGSRNLVLGYAMPGLKESLGLEDKLADMLPVGEGFAVEADVHDFELAGTYTAALTDLFQDMDPKNIDSLDDLEKSLSQLDDAAMKLLNGAGDLYSGTHQLNEKYQEFADGLTQLTEGIGQLSEGGDTLKSGLKTYTDGVDTLAAGVKEYTAGVVIWLFFLVNTVCGRIRYVRPCKVFGNLRWTQSRNTEIVNLLHYCCGIWVNLPIVLIPNIPVDNLST